MNIYDDVAIEILKLAFVHEFPECHRVRCPSPLPISQVNRWWRRVALATPQLWNCIHVSPHIAQPDGVFAAYLADTMGLSSLNDPHDYRRDPCMDMVAAYLGRSKDLPLSITIVSHKGSTLAAQNWCLTGPGAWPAYKHTLGVRYRMVWKLVFTQRYRWRHCALYPHLSGLLDEFIRDMQGATFPLLEYLGIHVMQGDRRAGQDFVFSAPKLANIRITGIDIKSCPPISSGALTELYLVKTDVDSKLLFGVLATAPIATLVLSEVHMLEESDYGAQSYPFLRRLCMDGVPIRPGLALFANAVALRSLFLCNDTILLPTIFAADVLTRFRRNSCAMPLLEELRMLGEFHINELKLLLGHRVWIGHPILRVTLDWWALRDFTCSEINSLGPIHIVRRPECHPARPPFWNDETDAPEFFPLEAKVLAWA